MTKPKKKKPGDKVKVNVRFEFHQAAVKAAKADRRGVELWLENAIIETAERQHDARKARK